MVSTETIQLILTALGPLSFGISYLLLKACRKLILSYMGNVATDLKNTFLDDIVQHPEIFDPFIGKMLARFTTKGTGGQGSMNIMGFKIPPMLQPLVGKFMEAAAKKFLPEIAEGAENVASSPFG